ncbi:DEAD/DEAH box helicase [Novosphingobium capsulatum]|uniref:DEAD/DEAH box helicase n=1 Tax=Novosphingobium capsulatum TaxID=13688 RepID=UPI000786B837|nr:DEAD/DEAH box helicase [Novosphingobium capsulatum]WQD92747.1 DEAD/DEAH box helicase [Novosphingobium capsulatum]
MTGLPLFTSGTTAAAKPLRSYQQRSIDLLRQAMLAGSSRIVLELCTGAGKTRIAAEIVKGARAKGNRVAFVVPAISLIDQTVEAFIAEGITEIGVMQGNHEMTRYEMPVQVCSVQTLAKRGVPDVELVIVDECHIQHEIIRQWIRQYPRVKFVGLSATPWAVGMAEYWQVLVRPVSMQELMDLGFLSPFRVFAPSHPDLSGVKDVAGDYNQDQLSDVMSDSVLVADIVETWLKRANGQPTLVFAVDRAHAAKLQAEFQRAGVPMGYCDANVDRIERKVLFERMARGELAGICNVGTLTTGVDADVRCIVLARPTRSEMLHVQIIGRALRTAPGKTEALILDHADNHARLGFVTDIRHEQLLDGKARKSSGRTKGESLPKECGSCKALKPPKVRECPHCGFVGQRQSDLETEEGDLIEVTPGRAPKAESTVDRANFYSQVLWIARERQRSPGWVAHTFRDRFGVWPRGAATRVQPQPPTDEVLSFVKAKDIRFAKRKDTR